MTRLEKENVKEEWKHLACTLIGLSADGVICGLSVRSLHQILRFLRKINSALDFRLQVTLPCRTNT